MNKYMGICYRRYGFSRLMGSSQRRNVQPRGHRPEIRQPLSQSHARVQQQYLSHMPECHALGVRSLTTFCATRAGCSWNVV